MDTKELNPNSLAKALNNKPPQPQIYRFLEGISKEPKRSTLEPIAAFFKVPVDAFFDTSIAQSVARELGIGQTAYTYSAPPSQPAIVSESTPYTVNLYSGTKMILAPVVEWARLGADLYKDNKEVLASRFEAITAGSKPNTKWVEVEADMPRLMLSRGDVVLITPVSGQHECKESKMHLFKTIGGAYFLGTFRRLASGFEAIPDSGPALESEKHGVQVVGIKHGHIESI